MSIVQRKYEVIRVCSCGRIHFIETELIDKAVTNDKTVILICAGCGHATLIGADKEEFEITGDSSVEDDEKYGYYLNMYSHTFSPNGETTIFEKDFQSGHGSDNIYAIFYSQGIKVPMKTGNYANSYYNGTFYDNRYPEELNNILYRKDLEVEDIIALINDHNKKSSTVNMDKLVKENPRYYLQELSQMNIQGLNWSLTNYYETLHLRSLSTKKDYIIKGDN